MTIQPTEAPAIDLELLVGEMPEVECAHPDHADDPEAHEGDATHYAQARCTSCARIGKVVPLCERFVAFAATGFLHCPKCGHLAPGLTVLRILGPVKS